MNRVRRVAALAFGASLLMVVACSGATKVTGVVVYKGAPLPGAMVSFHSADGNLVGTGLTNDSGEFSLQTAQGKDAIPPGTYKVVVTKTEQVAGDAPNLEGVDPKEVGKMMAGGAFPKGGKGPAGMPMPGKSPVKAKKSLIPQTFSSLATTTLEVSVPSKEPIRLDLGS